MVAQTRCCKHLLCRHNPPMENNTVLVDCQAGCKMGCHHLCCRLMVMLSMEDLENGLEPQHAQSGFLKQEKDGFCTYLDRERMMCQVWDKRPLACRLYNCNNDPKLQAIMRNGFSSFTKLIEEMKTIPQSEWRQVPLLDE